MGYSEIKRQLMSTNHKRDWIHVQDVCRAIRFLAPIAKMKNYSYWILDEIFPVHFSRKVWSDYFTQLKRV